jgi:hypothetical protein
MSYVGSSNQRAVLGVRFEEKENLAIHLQEGHDAPPADAILPRHQPSFFRPRAFKQVRRIEDCKP